MVAVLSYSEYQSYIDMGFKQEAVAHIGGIQHALGLDFVHGLGAAANKLTQINKASHDML